MIDARQTALLIIDVQRAIDDPSWGTRNNPTLESNLARLLDRWRTLGAPVIHVKHVSTQPHSTYRPGQQGCEFKTEVLPCEGEWVIEKHVNSAFIGTDLETRLRNGRISALVICGVITNNSVEATARMAGNLGFETVVVSDATATFGRTDYSGTWRNAGEVHAMSLANLDGEYARIATTDSRLEDVR